MGKKNKKEKKGKGLEKTALKTEKKAEKRAKRELAEIGEDEIKKQIAEYQDKAKDRTEVLEEKCPPPTPRSNISFTPHPDKEELFLFGGEYYTGKTMTLYDELYIYHIKKNEWSRITAPNAPPPRSSHQAVTLSQGGGQLWIFGGEFSSHSQSQFYHYRDLWVYHIKDKQWQLISAPGGPSSRSGHRMEAWKKQLVVFGGFHDNLREHKYFNDLYMFDTENYTWSCINTSGISPSPRSGCVLTVNQDTGRIVVYGGFCKEKIKKDEEKGTAFTDLYALTMEGKGEAAKWKWSQMKQSGSRPSTRCGVSATVAPGNRAILFGGVYDQTSLDEDDDGIFYNEMFSLDTATGKWIDVVIRGKKNVTEKKKRRKNKGGDSEFEEEIIEDTEDCLDDLKLEKQRDVTPATSEIPMETDSSVFTVKIGPQCSKTSDNSDQSVGVFLPTPRMNCALCVKGSILYLYGGLVEDEGKQITLADFYSLDLQKLDEWNTIIAEDKKLQEWEESDDDDEDSDSGEGAEGGDEESTDDDSDSDDEDITFEDAPKQNPEESLEDYFARSKEYWITRAEEIFEEDLSKLSSQKMEKLANELCKKALSEMNK